MANCALSAKLDSGVWSDIFYDSRDYDDHSATDVIDDFQHAVGQACKELDLVAEVDLSRDTISAEDLEILRGVQKRITEGDVTEGDVTEGDAAEGRDTE